MSYTIHKNCRGCGYGPKPNAGGFKSGDENQRLVSVLNLGVMPLPNAFKTADSPRPGHYPVELMVCPRCGLGQLSAVVDPEVMYSDYPYVTSPSETMRNHLDSLWEMLVGVKKIESVIEIGSNDGLCLEHFRGLGAKNVLGIDPAHNLVKIAKKRGINSVCSLFDEGSALEACTALTEPDLILARHVFCHIDNWQEFISNVGIMSSKETIVCIEVPYAMDLMLECQWDTVYAEHLSYLTILSMKHLLENTLFQLHHVVRFPVHGGAIAIILTRKDCGVEPNQSVEDYLKNERCGVSDWFEFAKRANDQIANMSILINTLRGDNKRVVGFGASAKSTMWINACKFTKKDIEAVYDYTPQKLYTFIPGTEIPVKHEGSFYADAADYAILWCWNFEAEVKKRQEKWLNGGGKFIVPVPCVRILD